MLETLIVGFFTVALIGIMMFLAYRVVLDILTPTRLSNGVVYGLCFLVAGAFPVVCYMVGQLVIPS